jgi:hypothetical protein
MLASPRLYLDIFFQIYVSNLENVVYKHISYIYIDYRGRHSKGIAIYNPTEVNLKQNIWFR